MKIIHNATVSGVTPIPILKPTDTEKDMLQARIDLLEHDLLMLLGERVTYRTALDQISRLGSSYSRHIAAEALRNDWSEIGVREFLK